MPNRILRDWTESSRMNSLDAATERFFIRLMMKADDYGCFHANARLLKANLFPLLLDSIREADISRWIAACEKAGLIVVYEIDSKPYLQIKDFGQRLDKARAKFPQYYLDNDSVPEEETERESENKNTLHTRKEKFGESLKPFLEKYDREMLGAFFRYWSEPNRSLTKMKFELEKTWDLSGRLTTWFKNEKKFSKEKSSAKKENPIEKAFRVNEELKNGNTAPAFDENGNFIVKDGY